MSDFNTPNNQVPADEVPPTASSYVPSNTSAAIDQMLSGRVSTADGTYEALRTVSVQRANSEGENEVSSTPIPSAQEFADQMTQQQGRLTRVNAELEARRYDPNTGAMLGYKVEGAARDRLEAERILALQTMQFVHARATELLPHRQKQLDAANAAAAEGRAADGAAAAEAGKREAAITQLAEQRIDGKAIGRVAAAKLYDEANARALADKLTRGR
jgi:hypothetical protein